MPTTLWRWIPLSLSSAASLATLCPTHLTPSTSREAWMKSVNYMAQAYPWILFKNLGDALGWRQVLLFASKLQELLPYFLTMELSWTKRLTSNGTKVLYQQLVEYYKLSM
ncbi:PREDICTED: uncharacterized protein LOC109235028 [Nicotiana attenuata]|uniref:uncharacterized protein LOC109235028 n=1 Tax=Nicotiana attenuata TaxID=49451 RepID=UPI000905C8C4|nr:PREDICTED: uncharacterized protein LOC109235028 [Nicotiana attenuata]